MDLPEGAFEELIQVFHCHAGCLRDSNVHVDQGDEAPASEEDEGTPPIHAFEDRGCSSVDTEVEEPVEGLRQG